ncbi:hypothetical protein PF007_g33114, partial [Phytophthora fragariae]
MTAPNSASSLLSCSLSSESASDSSNTTTASPSLIASNSASSSSSSVLLAGDLPASSCSLTPPTSLVLIASDALTLIDDSPVFRSSCLVETRPGSPPSSDDVLDVVPPLLVRTAAPSPVLSASLWYNSRSACTKRTA